MKKTYPIFFLLSLLLWLPSCKHMHLAKVAPENTHISTGQDSDETISGIIQPFKTQLDDAVNQEIGQAAMDMPARQPESLLTNWYADLIHQKAEANSGDPVDFATFNFWGIRIDALAKGPVTRGRIYEMMPFENRIVVMQLQGSAVHQLVQHMAGQGGWPVSASLRYEIRRSEAVNIRIDGKPIENGRTYRVAIFDYEANGGQGCSFLADKPRVETGKLAREVILEFIEEQTAAGLELSAKLDQRVSRVGEQ